jgi:hypothetical protein
MTMHSTDIPPITRIGVKIALFRGPVKTLNAVHDAEAVLTVVKTRPRQQVHGEETEAVFSDHASGACQAS